MDFSIGDGVTGVVLPVVLCVLLADPAPAWSETRYSASSFMAIPSPVEAGAFADLFEQLAVRRVVPRKRVARVLLRMSSCNALSQRSGLHDLVKSCRANTTTFRPRFSGLDGGRLGAAGNNQPRSD